MKLSEQDRRSFWERAFLAAYVPERPTWLGPQGTIVVEARLTVSAASVAAAQADEALAALELRFGVLVPVPRGHCGRCAACGWPLFESSVEGCTAASCSQRPLPMPPRSTCAGCGAPYCCEAA